VAARLNEAEGLDGKSAAEVAFPWPRHSKSFTGSSEALIDALEAT
jgi:hypothetical protein